MVLRCVITTLTRRGQQKHPFLPCNFLSKSKMCPYVFPLTLVLSLTSTLALIRIVSASLDSTELPQSLFGNTSWVLLNNTSFHCMS